MALFEEERAFLRAAVQELQEYLFSTQLFWRLSPDRRDRKTNPLQLTPGNLLLCEARLSALCVDRQDCQEISGLLEQAAKIRSEWKSLWQQKIIRELPNRLNAWKQYLNEAIGSGGNVAGYPFQVRLRVIVTLLARYLPGRLYQLELDSLDQLLRNNSSPAEFVWEPDLAVGFSPQEFWFLYRLPNRR